LGYYSASYIFIEVLEGVNYLHQMNPQIIHKNLKPENILLKYFDGIIESVEILDFDSMNFNQFVERSQPNTIDSKNTRYVAPEATNSCEYDSKADIYSLVIILR